MFYLFVFLDKKEESTKVSIEPESRELPDPFQYSPPLQCNVGRTKSKVLATTVKSLQVLASQVEMKAEDSAQKRGNADYDSIWLDKDSLLFLILL